jgi:hypothetical protein
MVEIVNALALGKPATVPQKLQELRMFVSAQPESLHVEWGFEGTQHYVQTEQIFAPYRAWLMDLFSIAESKDRAGLLSAIDRTETGFAKIQIR